MSETTRARTRTHASPNSSVTIHQLVLPPDCIVALKKYAERCELEENGLKHFVEKQGIVTKRIGREICCRESDLLAAFDAPRTDANTSDQPPAHPARVQEALRMRRGGRK